MEPHTNVFEVVIHFKQIVIQVCVITIHMLKLYKRK